MVFEMRKSLSKRDKVLLSVMAVAVTAFAYYYFAYSPIMAHIDEQKERYVEIENELSSVNDTSKVLASTLSSSDKIIADISKIISSYYPYIEPQYFVSLMCVFSEELGLSVAHVNVAPPTLRDLSKLIPDKNESESRNPFDSALADIDGMSDSSVNSTSQDSESADNGNASSGDASPANAEQPPAEVGTVLVSRLSFSIYDGNFEKYLKFLNKVNNTGYPIYVSQYTVFPNTVDNSLEMDITINVIHLDRLSAQQYMTDASQFTFDVLPPSGSGYDPITAEP